MESAEKHLVCADIGAVIVTYNRLEKLKKTLSLFDAQTLPPAYIIIVDNASTDGTGGFLADWKQSEDGRYRRYVLTSKENEGGSGGFYRGLEYAVSLDTPWIWVSDDDAYPVEDTFRQAQMYLHSDPVKDHWDDYSAVCAGVLDDNGWNLCHRRWITCEGGDIKTRSIPEEQYLNSSFELNAFSYVGAIMNVSKLKQVGITKKEYFIYFDDTEHSLRMSKAGKIVCVPAVKVYHYDPEESEQAHRWKLYYRIRNQFDMYRLHMPKGVFLRYYLGLYRRSVTALLKNRKDTDARITKQALDDMRRRKFGKHPVYYPGAVIKS